MIPTEDSSALFFPDDVVRCPDNEIAWVVTTGSRLVQVEYHDHARQAFPPEQLQWVA